MIEMVVESVRVNLINPNRVVVLKERDRDRYLAIVIGGPEADSIAIKLQDRTAPRPLTHDLLKNVIEDLGAGVSRILINDLVDQVYYARIVLDIGGRESEVDSRPSDAIALAVRVGASIFVSEEVLDAAGIEPDDEDVFSGGVDSEPAVTDEQLKPFRDFINQLDLDDLGHD
jgi:bifunctional DNase/RNase